MPSNNPVYNLIAGGLAGGVEAIITYPTEYVKTQVQLQDGKGPRLFNGPLDCLRHTVRTHGVSALYRGMSALVVGNASKAAVRFVAYEQIKQCLAEEDGSISSFKSIIAGMGAGIAEGALVVTPTETIKVKLIHDQSRPVPKYKGLIHGTTTIIREEGLSGIYRGLLPVILRQGANQAVRFSVYSTLKQHVLSRHGSSQRDTPLPWYTTFGIGVVAGVTVVYTTMPLDVLKTRMQGLDAGTKYRNSLDCVWKVVRDEGVLALWKGAVPRLSRLVFSSGIVFSIYENALYVLNKL